MVLWRVFSIQLALTTILCGAIGVALPFTPFARLLGFVAVPWPDLGAIAIIVILYAVAVEMTKLWFFRRPLHAETALPVRHAMETR